ncbi:uncharacterized protein HMPREF1541_05980 [Cyphellophora europaea CBS 101466]|uniref:Uncharacterized protein n=1 Tax=Cyphellophora europaea (strain CBS 101466) TaxID=1220924 RepID=W2RVM5_CYPE1|nr:uncharacterized protein HMPREF1541_05980 [Cyphellophora europaea CBS 101466]ETN39754.1 hypothetical protein HMPREF1541_05980 [Cyphellophora europaea CBS 101466]
MQRNKNSFLAVSGALVLLLVLFYVVGPGSDLASRDNNVPVSVHNAHGTVYESETTDDFGVIKYTHTRLAASSDLLWLTITYDNTSWGHNPEPDNSIRCVHDLLNIISAQHDVEKTSLGLLTSSMDEYHQYKEAVTEYAFARVTIFMHTGFNDGPTVAREHRHDGDVQTLRRAEISKLRNYLMLQTLREEAHIVWLDADVFRLDDGIVDRILRHVRARDDIGIITARCSLGGMYNYDLNAWRGTREGPRGWDLDQKEIDAGEMDLQGQYHVDKLIKDTSDDDLLALDTVGATLLYLRASLIWRGLNFPHQYVVGTRWMKDGWDGIESEGLCYRARGLKGGKCMVLGGRWHVEHTTD